MGAFDKMLRKVKEFLPGNSIKHFISPGMVKDPKVPYDAQKYFESKYRAILDKEFSDRVTISPYFNPLFARYHYNSVENGIIEYFASAGFTERPNVLDVGSGAGHWIDFYIQVFDAASVVGVEFSRRCADDLRKKYSAEERVHIVEDDISSSGFRLDQRFEIINAIGVIFHIVDDHAWKRTIGNLANLLNRKGIIVVGGQFGLVTQNVGFTPTDVFSSWEEFLNADQTVELVKKRIRSLRYWKKCARQNELSVRRVHRTKRHRDIISPENNLLFLSAIP